jgi:hypothetical protein
VIVIALTAAISGCSRSSWTQDKGAMATIGRNCAVAEMKRRFVLSGFIGWVTWMVVHLWYLIGFRNKVIVSIDWLWNYFTYVRGVRAIIHPSGSVSQEQLPQPTDRSHAFKRAPSSPPPRRWSEVREER